MPADGLIVLAADEVGRGVSQEHGAQFFYAHLKPRSFRRILARHLRRGDLLLNLSVDVSSLDLLTYAAESGALYVDTSIEPWPGVFDNPMLDLRQRSNFTTRRRALQLAAELGRSSPTAVVDHGANPGLVSHFVKRALLELDRTLRKGSSRPASREDWATLARDLGVTLIQISERDTQVSDRPKRPGEFVNTWSIDGFMDEAMQPSELSFGTAERQRPRGTRIHQRDSGTLFMNRPGAATFARSWTPAGGGFQGLMMSHDEVFSIGDLLSLRNGGHLTYRPTVMFVYHPCDDAMLSVLELEGRGWQPQQRQRRLGADIVTGMDELGVLLAGHSTQRVLVRLAAVDRGRTAARALRERHERAGRRGRAGRRRLGDPQPEARHRRARRARLRGLPVDRHAVPRPPGRGIHDLDAAAGPR